MTPKEELVIKFNHIILVQGFSNFSMVDLAKMADISRAKLYIYFKNKDQIVNSVVDRHLEFLKKYPIPTTAKDENLLSTILNSLLLLGSTTELFESELREKYPQLYRNFKRGYETYFSNLKSYYENAQENHLIIKDISAEFILFQNRINIRGILDDVRNNQLSLNKGEQYLAEYFTYQIHSLLLNKTPIIPDDIKKFSKVIINEYYDTYANINH
ncbi:TetR/AcrR family transcriptional regulator [Companilactobacillus huachuanensis]|uniref:TetR/AcrR family transcriptional regulator n=1 Tax=Companilactobacillus huachuanensis TaxID=2559914 RepID=A0ABW1RNL7_9LACO|nr:TetR/AcrR family transcriptional regulator [Companilactobacillus huachuanensis]